MVTQGVKATLLPDSLLEALLTSPAEHPAVASIVGGFLGQEVLKAVSGKGTPLQNFFLYDLASGDGKVEHLQAPAANPPNKKAKVSSQ
jgi:ubiquitin-like 1-activating enzyme E1 A